MHKDNMKNSEADSNMGHHKTNNSEFEVMQSHNASQEKIDNNGQKVQQEVVNLMEELAKLDVSYKGMLAREERYLKNIASLKQEIRNLDVGLTPSNELKKMQTNYEGMLAREERYLKEIANLKETIESQKEGLYKTYSYRLGYLLIHSTQSFNNFIKLPSRLFGLYKENKSRKKAQQDNKKNNVTYGKLNNPLFKQSLGKSYISNDVKIATIMDEFTSLCFAPEANTLQITPDNFKQELADFQPDMLFIESAWQGKDGSWKLKVSQQADELLDLIEHCRKNSIKTMFWNKEDPVHFGTFIAVARLVDVVFTTDIDCIKKYKEVVQHDDVYLLPFAAQPKTHNPIELYKREEKFNFAGSYYLKYPVRQRDFAVLSSVAKQVRGLDIYDRNYHNDHPHYQFPDQYQSMILGSLPPEEIDKAYKGYEFGINMNTIKQSQTMFARRVFEMLASNTIVLSNYSRGVRLLFGDLVICSDNANELQRQLDSILIDDITRKKFKLQGLRSVLKQHTYEHRLNYILQKLKIEQNASTRQDKVLVIAKCQTESEIAQVVSQFNQQTAKNTELYLLTNAPTTNNGTNIHYFKNIGDLESEIVNHLDFSYVTVFNPKDYYGAHYLEDMLLADSYLKYQGSPVVTKDHYYDYQKKAELIAGKEYDFVEQFSTTRSLISKNILLAQLGNMPLLSILQDKIIKEKAFSIDSFSYIKNGSLADTATRALVCDNLVLDSGVSLTEHLLPIAEAISIKKYEAPINKVLSLDSKIIEGTLIKGLKLQVQGHVFDITSELPENQHRLITLTKSLDISNWNKVVLNAQIKSEGDVLFVFEFLDKDNQQISHISHATGEALSLEIPKGTIYCRAHVRVKGTTKVSMASPINLKLENITTSIINETYDDNDIVSFTKDDMNSQLVRPKSKQLTISNRGTGLEIVSTLGEGKHAYIYFKDTFKREDVNLLLNSVFETKGDVIGFDLRTVFLFLDKNKEKLAHSIIKVDNYSHAMAIPEACEYVRIGFKVTGTGSVNLHSLKIGELQSKVSNFVGKSDTLVLAKQYPAYNDLYKYGFLHSRLRAYKKNDVLVDMFKIGGKNSKFGFSEFEAIDIFTGDAENLRETLKSGQFKRVLVHIIDKNMWTILEEFSEKIEFFIWVHGSEAQVWQRRAYEFDGLPNKEVERRKRMSDQRKEFWQSLVDKKHPNLKLVFVSKYFKNEFVADMCDGIENFNYEIIHNYIDNKLFPFHQKKAEEVYKVLSIRPFSSLTYANDLTVKAILELSTRKEFKKFQFTIVGDGALFDTTVEPLKKFPNVILRKEFLSQIEIAKLHQENGVFLVPTRMDTQGVSRGEASSSGLVVITSNIAAIPEFVSSDDGVIVNPEDYKMLADEMIRLTQNIDKFNKLSKKGYERVIQQCGFSSTIFKELELINGKY